MQLNHTYVEADWDGNGGVIGPIPTNWRGGPAALRITITGTINYDVEQTLSDLQNETSPIWFIDDATTQDGATASQTILMDIMPRAIRIPVNSSTGATVTLDLVQSDV